MAVPYRGHSNVEQEKGLAHRPSRQTVQHHCTGSSMKPHQCSMLLSCVLGVALPACVNGRPMPLQKQRGHHGTSCQRLVCQSFAWHVRMRHFARMDGALPEPFVEAINFVSRGSSLLLLLSHHSCANSARLPLSKNFSLKLSKRM